MRAYCTEDAGIIVALGSVLGTVKDTVDELRERGVKIGVVGIACFRPLAARGGGTASRTRRRVVVLEKSLAVGVGGIVSTNIRIRCGPRHADLRRDRGAGRAFHHQGLACPVFADAIAGRLEPHHPPRSRRGKVVDRVLGASGRSGAAARSPKTSSKRSGVGGSRIG